MYKDEPPGIRFFQGNLALFIPSDKATKMYIDTA